MVLYFLTQLNNFDSRKQQIIINQQLTNPTSVQINRQRSLDHQQISDQITTEFVPWCCKYFLKPLLSTQPNVGNIPRLQSIPLNNALLPLNNTIDLFMNKQVDMYATEFLDQHCKLLYNHKVKRKTPPRWSEPQSMTEILQIKHTTYPIHCKFHPYNDQLFIVDKDCMINVYETQFNNKLKLSFSIFQNQFNYNQISSPANVKKPVVTSFNLINVQHEPIFLAGTDDRIVRIFKPDLTNYTKSSLITAFKAFGDSQKRASNIEVGLIVEWDEPNEILLCSGDTGHIRVWDMNKELYKDYSTQAPSCVCSLSTYDNYTVAGFGDGTIKLFDFRLSNANVASFRANNIYQHNSFVLKVKIHKPSNKLITSSTSGDINLIDLRSFQNVLKSTINNEPATAIECHPVNELIAV